MSAIVEVIPDPDLPECPACGSINDRAECTLGTLGALEWYRCRYCGDQWHGDNPDCNPDG